MGFILSYEGIVYFLLGDCTCQSYYGIVSMEEIAKGKLNYFSAVGQHKLGKGMKS